MEPSSLELVEAAIAGTGWKSAGLALEARVPDAACAHAIMTAYRSGRCEAWMAAWLLGANGHPDGYETVLAILRSGAGKGSESYAGVALAKMRGDDALPDLVAILDEPHHARWVHEGAAFGLGEIRDPRALEALLAAVDRGRVRESKAGFIAHEHGVTPIRLLAWLRGDDATRREIAAWAVLHWSANTAVAGPIPEDICRVLLGHIKAGRSPFNSEQREFMRERLSRR